MHTLAIIHTTAATVEPLKTLAVENIQGCTVINFVDDSILPQLATNAGQLSDVQERLVQYAVYAEQAGADVILEACSSVGEVVPWMAERVSVPVVRIDEAMAEEAVQRGKRIGVAATLETTLNPTLRLLEEKAIKVGKRIEYTTVLADGAYRKLIAGDRDGHDSDLLEILDRLAYDVDVVVLAQASMARVVTKLPEETQDRFLSSPYLGMERVRKLLTD